GPLVEAGYLERAAGAGGRLLEDETDLLPFQVLLLGPGVLGPLEIAGEIEQIAKLPLCVVLDGQEGTIAQVEAHGLPLSGSFEERCGSVRRVAPYGAGHAMAAAAAATKLGPANRDHFDAGLSEQRIRVPVAVVGHDDAGLERHHVVAVIPLLALGLVDVAAGLDHPKFLNAQGALHHVEQ